MTPEQLDDLFRANDARAGFGPQAGEWEEMSALLDEDERRGGAARWVSAAWLLLFVSLIIGGIVGAVRYAPGGGGGERLAPKRVAVMSDPLPPVTRGEAYGSRAPLAEPVEPGARGVRAAPPVVQGEQLASGAPLAETVEPGARGVRADPPVSRGEQLAPGAPVAEPIERDVAALPPLDIPLVEFWRKPNLPTLAPSAPPPHSSPPSNAFEFHIILAAEANEVDMHSPLAFGALAGVGLQYRVARHWSVGAAALVGKKNYVAGPEQTRLPKEMFVDEVMPTSTSVDATILEFPINLTYLSDRSGGKRDWYAHASLNSFQLLSDRMTYTYPEVREGQFAVMDDASPGGAFGSSVRLGGGIALRPSREPRLYVGPYVELPLKRTGYSEVSLYTFGLQVQLGL